MTTFQPNTTDKADDSPVTLTKEMKEGSGYKDNRLSLPINNDGGIYPELSTD
jgi:hypothetical protein